ncbi:MAG: hypothetical protein FVQ81_13240 [Candidatus Glassbacteria bacterium]|nr:hypothetical protein [Candidatus Glassbacteria bacterium]
MFHAHDGWYFERTPDGGVRILKRKNARPDAPVEAEIEIDAYVWASIVSHVSEQGDIAETFNQALKLHQGEDQ